MNKKLLTIAIALVIFVVVASPVSALPTKSPLPTANPWNFVWGLFQDLQKQIDSLNAKVNNIPDGVHFGTWNELDPNNPYGDRYKLNTHYVAATDGFVVVDAATFPSATVDFNMGGNTPAQGALPQIKRSVILHPGDIGGFTIPVRAGDTWEIAGSPAMSTIDLYYRIYWIPLSS